MTPKQHKVAVIGQKGVPCTLGGVERFVEEVTARQVAQGYDMVVYTRPHYTDKKLASWRGVRLASVPSINSKHLDAISHSLLSVLHAIFIERADLIFIVNVGPALISWLPRLLSPRIRVLGKFESLDWTHTKWGGFAQLSLKLGAWCICRFPHRAFAVSEEIQAYAAERYGRAIPVVHNGYTIRPPMQAAARQALLDAFALSDNRYFFTASRLANHKGIHYLIQAFMELKDDSAGAFADIALVIAGEGYHTDEYVAQLHRLAADRSDIHFVGHQSGETLQALYEGALAYVHASEAEGFSMSLVEALGYCRLVIASDIPSGAEAVTMGPDRYAALLFQSTNVDELRQRMCMALTTDLDAFGREAREFAEQRYGWDAIAAAVTSQYQLTLSKDDPDQ